MMNEVSTKDIFTASFLVARENQIIRTSRNGRDVIFHFTDTPKVREDFDDLQFGNDLIRAQLLFAARTHLMRLIHDGGITQ